MSADGTKGTSTDELFKNDEKLKGVDRKAWNSPSADMVKAAVSKMKENAKFDVIEVKDKAAALAKVKELIPKGSSVNTAGSTTLGEIGLVDFLKGDDHGWRNIKAEILAEKDEKKQAELRRTVGVSPDYHLTSASAIDAESGALHLTCLTGTRTGPALFGPSNVVVVVGKNKVVKDAAAAKKRLEEYCLPVESARVRIAFASMGVQGSQMSFVGQLNNESPFAQEKRVHVIFVDEDLGF